MVIRVFGVCDKCGVEFAAEVFGSQAEGYQVSGEYPCPQCRTVNRLECRISACVPAARRAPDPDDGGPAFPTGAVPDLAVSGAPGMSLRDWFAGQALMGLIAAEVFGSKTEVAEHAYYYADKMLERSAGKAPSRRDHQRFQGRLRKEKELRKLGRYYVPITKR